MGYFYGKWSQWFAWRPIKIRNKYIWLKHVYRRKVYGWESYSIYTEYGELFDVLKTK